VKKIVHGARKPPPIIVRTSRVYPPEPFNSSTTPAEHDEYLDVFVRPRGEIPYQGFVYILDGVAKTYSRNGFTEIHAKYRRQERMPGQMCLDFDADYSATRKQSE